MPLQDPALLKSIFIVSQLAEFSTVSDSQKCRVITLSGGARREEATPALQTSSCREALAGFRESAVKISLGGAEL